MIRIVKTIEAVDLDGNLANLPLIPASGVLSTAMERGDQGLSEKFDLSFRIESDDIPSLFYADLILTVSLDNGETVTLGSTYIPVRLTFRREDVITVSCTWQKAV